MSSKVRWSLPTLTRRSVSVSDDEADQGGSLSIQEPGEDDEPFYTVDEAIEKIGFGVYQVVMMSFSGLIWTVEAFEILILSILSASLKCEWGLSSVEEASLTAFVFVGFMIGAVLFGVIADAYGRKRCLFLVAAMSAMFGFLSAFAPNLSWMIFLRCMLGIAAGGSAQGTTFCIEFLPAKTRAVTITITSFFWIAGAIGIVVMAMLTVPTIGWRYLLGFAAIPVTVMSFVVPFVPSSPRYLISKGKKIEALRVLNGIAKINCKPPLRVKLLTDDEKDKLVASGGNASVGNGSGARGDEEEDEHDSTEFDPLIEEPHQQEVEGQMVAEGASSERVDEQGLTEGQRNVEDAFHGANSHSEEAKAEGDGEYTVVYSVSVVAPEVAENSKKSRSFLHLWQDAVPLYLFKNGMWKSTLLLWPIWLLVVAYYYGIILLTTTIFQYDKHCPGSELPLLDLCKVLDQDDYNTLVWTSAAEAPGIVLTLVILIFIGRKKVMALEFIALTGFTCLLFVCGGRIYLTAIIFVCRGLIAGIFQALFVYTPEVYPTRVRALGLGISSTVGRIGGIVVPYIAQVVFPVSDVLGFCIFIGMALASAILTFLLPIETKGRSLKDVGGTH